ncbi:MAG: cell division protein FtsK, partial [Myxococcaceae bacterium]|nr:cell division protein FtsK [Myxococcaceae bacterium]
QELLRASAQQEVPAPPPRPSAPAAPPPMPAVARAPAQDPDEAHFQEVYRDFVRTREQCGEPPDGLTYEKFALKLRKNKDQLVAKYGCRTVRFQVYVKEGRAALKATPVKD